MLRLDMLRKEAFRRHLSRDGRRGYCVARRHQPDLMADPIEFARPIVRTAYPSSGGSGHVLVFEGGDKFRRFGDPAK
jgi:hypothetical protein